MTQPRKNESRQDFLKRCTSTAVSKEGKDQRQAYAACNAVWDGKKNGVMSVTVPVQLSEVNSELAAGGKARGFLITAKSGKPIDRGYYKFAIDMSGVRFENKMPILRQHDPLRVVGFGQGFKDGDSLFVEGEFSSVTSDGAEVLKLADEGYPWQASIGIWPDKYKVLQDEKESETVNGYEVKGPAIIYQKSHVREVSFVALGADPDTAAIALSDDADDDITELNERKSIMDKDQLKKEHPELFAAITQEGYQLGQADERQRVAEILDAGADQDVTLTAIKDGTAAGDAYKVFFAAEKQKRVRGLEELANQATPPQGATPPETPAAASTESADKQVSRLARAMAKEHKIGIADAISRVLSENADLAAKYKAMTDVQ